MASYPSYMDFDEVRKTRIYFAIPFCTKNDRFYKDRLGTNISESAQKEMRFAQAKQAKQAKKAKEAVRFPEAKKASSLFTGLFTSTHTR